MKDVRQLHVHTQTDTRDLDVGTHELASNASIRATKQFVYLFIKFTHFLNILSVNTFATAN
jgi:hypothetical protein